MQRGNKGRLVAMGNKNLSSASVLRFLLCALQPPPANSLRVCAAASAALWAILFHCERAKPALKALVGGVGGVGGGGGIGGKGGGVVAMNPVASALPAPAACRLTQGRTGLRGRLKPRPRLGPPWPPRVACEARVRLRMPAAEPHVQEHDAAGRIASG